LNQRRLGSTYTQQEKLTFFTQSQLLQKLNLSFFSGFFSFHSSLDEVKEENIPLYRVTEHTFLKYFILRFWSWRNSQKNLPQSCPGKYSLHF